MDRLTRRKPPLMPGKSGFRKWAGNRPTSWLICIGGIESMMITRQIRCRKCGLPCSITYPEKLSDIGKDIISLCDKCRGIEIQQLKIKREGDSK